MDKLQALLKISEIVISVFNAAKQISEEEQWAKSIDGLYDYDYYTRQYQVLAADGLKKYEEMRQILLAAFGESNKDILHE